MSIIEKIRGIPIGHLIEHPAVPTSPHYSRMGWFLFPVPILATRCLQSQLLCGTDLQFQGNLLIALGPFLLKRQDLEVLRTTVVESGWQDFFPTITLSWFLAKTAPLGDKSFHF